MKLVSRVSVFFLVALAIILIVFSSVFYAFVRIRLVHQFEQELHGALHSLVAAVEVEPEDVSWQPLEHTIALGVTEGPDEVQWVVLGDRSHIVESSPKADLGFVAQAKEIAVAMPLDAEGRATDSGQLITNDWRLVYQRLAASSPDASHRDPDEFDEIVVVVAISAVPLNSNLRGLFLLTCALPLATWLFAAAVGHWFCRRALQPILEMSEKARSMSRSGFQSRLPTVETKDELADLAASFNKLLDHQQRAFEQQRRFTGNAAHELRTPLTVLLGQIDVALRRTRTPEEYAATLQTLRDETVQLRSIVESLLFLARAEEDAILPDVETLCIADWLPKYMIRWDEHPRHDDLRLAMNSIGAQRIQVSPTLLARLLDNLIENALKYSSPDSKVEVSASVDKNELLVSVEDHGRGIAAENMAEVFQPFFRTREAREAGISGTGLGLAIAARIAGAFSGRLDGESVLGRGSRFSLRLPLDSASRDSAKNA